MNGPDETVGWNGEKITRLRYFGSIKCVGRAKTRLHLHARPPIRLSPYRTIDAPEGRVCPKHPFNNDNARHPSG